MYGKYRTNRWSDKTLFKYIGLTYLPVFLKIESARKRADAPKWESITVHERH